MELFRKPEQGNSDNIAEAAVMAEEILKRLQEERLNGAEKKKDKAAKKNKAKKPRQGEKRQGKITEEKVWKFFEVISKM
jgi:hypothetical protein